MRVPAVVRRHPSLRWLLPIGVAGVAAVAASGVFTTSASIAKLPRTSPSALLAAVGSPAVTGFSGTVVSHVSLGLPDVPSVGDVAAGSPLVALLSGSRTLQVWYGGVDRQRIALLGSTDETDLFRSGRTLWRWDSGDRVADRVLLPRTDPGSLQPGAAATGAAATGTAATGTATAGAATTGAPTAGVAGSGDPLSEASMLPSLTPSGLASAAVRSLDATTRVDVQSGRSVADRAAYELVLRPRSATSRIGAVHIAVDGQTKIPLGVQIYPRDSSVPAIDVSYTSIQFSDPAETNFRFTPPAGAKVNRVSMHDLRDSGALSPGRVSVSGADWSTVLGYDTGHAVRLSGLGLGRAVIKVSGTWGQGRLLQTNLLCALLTSDGRIYVGAVDPSALYAAAGNN